MLKKHDALRHELFGIDAQINSLTRQIALLKSTTALDVVKGTRADGTIGSIRIEGVPVVEIEEKRKRLNSKLAKYESVKAEIEGMIDDIESFIFTVPDPEMRTMLRMKYIDGATWRTISKEFKKKSPSWAKEKVKKFLNDC